MFYGWHSDEFGGGESQKMLDELIAKIAEWVEVEQRRKTTAGDIDLAAFTFLEEGDPINHDRLVEADVELTPHWDLDIFLNNDYYSEI